MHHWWQGWGVVNGVGAHGGGCWPARRGGGTGWDGGASDRVACRRHAAVQGVAARQHEGAGGGTWTGKCVEAGGPISQGRETWVRVRRGWCGPGHIGVGCGSWCVGGKVHGGWGVDRLGVVGAQGVCPSNAQALVLRGGMRRGPASRVSGAVGCTCLWEWPRFARP